MDHLTPDTLHLCFVLVFMMRFVFLKPVFREPTINFGNSLKFVSAINFTVICYTGPVMIYWVSCWMFKTDES